MHFEKLGCPLISDILRLGLFDINAISKVSVFRCPKRSKIFLSTQAFLYRFVLFTTVRLRNGISVRVFARNGNFCLLLRVFRPASRRDGMAFQQNFLWLFGKSWAILCFLFLNECFRVGSLTASQPVDLLRLIHKKDDRRLPRNWRPITLLNTDYKLALEIIIERLKRVMTSVVHQGQTCGVVGRSIFSNLQLIKDTLDMIDRTN